MGPEALLQSGALGIVAYVTYWLTRKLNGKVDALAVHLRENTEAVRALTSAIERNGK